MKKGIFYGVSVGPGNPKLMTLESIEIIQNCQIIASPRTKTGNMVAYDIAKQVVDLKDKTVVPLDFAMSHNLDEKKESHNKAVEKIQTYLDKGFNIAMLNLGDVSIYASFHYLADILKQKGYEIKMTAGVPSFCAAASQLCESLTNIEKPIHIYPAAKNQNVQNIQDGTTIWMKSGSSLSCLVDKLNDMGLADNAYMVQNCGMENQRIYKGLKNIHVQNDYFSLVILKEQE